MRDADSNRSIDASYNAILATAITVTTILDLWNSSLLVDYAQLDRYVLVRTVTLSVL